MWFPLSHLAALLGENCGKLEVRGRRSQNTGCETKRSVGLGGIIPTQPQRTQLRVLAAHEPRSGGVRRPMGWTRAILPSGSEKWNLRLQMTYGRGKSRACLNSWRREVPKEPSKPLEWEGTLPMLLNSRPTRGEFVWRTCFFLWHLQFLWF